jgi:photosystem II stability/assembly factor-like uncharacterized protein
MVQLNISNNGGQTWTRQPDLTWAGSADALAALSEKRAFFGVGQGMLLGTTDSGADWNVMIPLGAVNPGYPGGWVVRFYQGAYGWAALQDRLFRTTTAGEIWEMGEIK